MLQNMSKSDLVILTRYFSLENNHSQSKKRLIYNLLHPSQRGGAEEGKDECSVQNPDKCNDEHFERIKNKIRDYIMKDYKEGMNQVIFTEQERVDQINKKIEELEKLFFENPGTPNNLHKLLIKIRQINFEETSDNTKKSERLEELGYLLSKMGKSNFKDREGELSGGGDGARENLLAAIKARGPNGNVSNAGPPEKAMASVLSAIRGNSINNAECNISNFDSCDDEKVNAFLDKFIEYLRKIQSPGSAGIEHQLNLVDSQIKELDERYKILNANIECKPEPCVTAPSQQKSTDCCPCDDDTKGIK